MTPDNYSLLKCKNGHFLLENSDMISKVMRFYGEWGENSIEVMRLFLEKGNTAVDIGANIGTITMALADAVGDTGKVYAFEAQRQVFYNLCTNIMMNSKKRVFARRLLIGDRQGNLPLRNDSDEYNGETYNRGGKSFAEEMKNGNQVNSGYDRVNMNTLDDELTNLDTVDLIKIDVEGAEPMVLRGAERTLDKHCPTVYLECGNSGLFEEVIPILKRKGYKCYWHAALHFRPDNYFRCGNVTGQLGDLNILAVPPRVSMREGLVQKFKLKECIDWQQVKEEFADFVF